MLVDKQNELMSDLFFTTMSISPAGSLEAKTAGSWEDFVSVLPKENERA